MALTTDLISYYKFDETTGTTANDAVGSNDGTINGATINQTGKIGKAYDFDGSGDYISLPSMTFQTISVWVYIDSTQTEAPYIIDARTGVSNGWIYFNDHDGDTLDFGSAWSTVYVDNVVVTSGSTTVTKNEWHHIVGILSSSGTDNIFIGCRYSLADYMNGKFDEIGVWNRTLTSTEVSELYNSGDGLQYPFSTASTIGKIWGIALDSVISIG